MMSTPSPISDTLTALNVRPTFKRVRALSSYSSQDHLKVSIIINTDGRSHSLEKTLHSLSYLDYCNFEVCVVCGPTQDGTRELVESWSDRIKVGYCPTRNLSQSRNIGLALSSGEIVAFLDDDSIPESEWLSKVVAPFSDPGVAACGGFLLDHTGVNYQWRFGTANRMGSADTTWERAAPELNFPYTANFPHVMANSAFRLSSVLAVGGFDEQYIYFLDETDLICRLIDHGCRIIQLSGALVHHKFAASHIRTEERFLTSWYAVVRSKIYFSIVNAQGHHDLPAAIADAQDFIEKFREGLEWGISIGKLSSDLRNNFKEEIDRAFRSGLEQGLANNRIFYDEFTLKTFNRTFLRFPNLDPDGERRTICLLSKTFPPATIGGIGRYTYQLARSLACVGHQVHVLTQASEFDTVDFEDGVWVHRITPKSHRRTSTAMDMRIPAHIWDYSATMLNRLREISKERKIDGVCAPIWDCEGIAILMSGDFRLITSLHTTFKFWLANHRHLMNNKDFMEDFINPMIEAERFIFENSEGIKANSHAIVTEIKHAYNVDFGSSALAIIPHGQEDWCILPSKLPKPQPSGTLRVLFVGRLEERKGVDVLLAVLPEILESAVDVHVDIVGNDQLIGNHGLTYRSDFENAHAGQEYLDRVHFHGEVQESELRGFYKACDIFVAPSRFESFGLILLEAMMFGKPVIGCRSGGMVEVVEDGVSGLLSEPGDAASLATAIRSLLESVSLREHLGYNARMRYETTFTPNRMAIGLLDFLADLAKKDQPSSRLENAQ